MIVLTLFIGAAICPSLLASANGETVDLGCVNHFTGSTIVGMWVTVDTTANTVAWWVGTMSRKDAYTSSATVTEDAVTWDTRRPSFSEDYNFSLDRNTGVLSIRPLGTGNASKWDCKKTARAF